ncbi:BRCA2-interacting transcriptional repressor EMSY isoform X1 [Ctenopharyngodon idella]|uniref:BRCA2-interacting transcriptional repressor EMSY isoform X1 n=1 Tax=Ctenopharyngodon idella TaxID=7959 RepID=UPI00222E07E3|nr:BRCA2-interacting transcriptional repressor EMSY isoform X1 [Ctenopharyngodon idella]XP_051767400.1 BRCA2-interacting transcriptional repressor EMSY isoform X1 [Ctenopharyngodon idella]XP_051767401.1 BRCA2-interacting transcriptional repressor EMSY isoform X1 [Ctenopharyngodon idella]XP_051767402.1 BRCA2-interacting transcriptional repressor EMSY isoform X1 [Ctenopharyngodon idella]XP_051767403.1 BRCA2-interacting transcriptional repressor EMSY isoform X1 [Ctenopharyngodon idella]XP_0517674
MIQQEKPLAGSMPVVWPTLLDLSRDECKRILRKLELEAYAGVISALRAQGDLTKDKKELLGELTRVLSISTERHRAEVRRAVNDERLNTIAYHMSGPNSSSEWSIEGRRLVPLMPRLVPQTAFTVTANAVANATAHQNASLLLPAETANKEVVVCYSYTSTSSTPPSASAPSSSAAAAVKSPRPASPASNVVVLPSGSTVYVKSVSCSDEDEKPRKRRRTNSSSSSPVLLKEVPKVATPTISKTITVPVSGSPKMSNLMQSIANSLPPHMSPVKITFTKPSTQTTNTTTQKVIIVTTSPSSNFVPNILSKSHNYAAVSKLVSSAALTASNQKQTMVISSAAPGPSPVAVTTVVSSTPSVVMSTIAQGGSSTAVKVASTRLPSPKALVGSPSQILQIPKAQQQSAVQSASPKALQASISSQSAGAAPGAKPTIQIKQESGVKIITQQMQPSKILPKPSGAALPSSSSAPIMVVSSNGAIMTTKLVSNPTGTQATYTRPSVSPAIGARVATSPAGATYVKTTSGSIITVVPKSLATLGGKIITSNMVSGTTTKITTIPMTSKPNVIVVQKTTGKGTTIQGLPGKNVVTTLLNAGVRSHGPHVMRAGDDAALTMLCVFQGEKSLQAVSGAKPAIITASRPITKMIVTQPKSLGAGVQPTTATKIIPTKIVYGQQGKTQVLIKPKPMAFQTAVVSEQARQLVSETLQQVSRSAESAAGSAQEGALKDDSASFTEGSPVPSDSTHDSQPVVHVITSRGQDWTEQEVAVEASPTIIYQDVTGESQSATSTIKALLELQQTSVKEKSDTKPRQHTIDLSQMAVPIPAATERRQSPEPSGQTAGETDTVTEYIPIVSGKVCKAVIGGEVTASSSQNQSTSCPPPAAPATAKSSTAAPGAATQQVEGKPLQEQMLVEEGEFEGDTLDPQTGLFYRSSQQHLSKPAAGPSETPTSSKRAEPVSARPSVQRASASPSAGPPPAAPPASSNPPHTPQLPRLQQAPTSHNRPNTHTQLSQPPPLQAHHPVGSGKTAGCSGQVQQPIITQGATVTKITFGSHHQCPPVSSSGEASVKLQPESSSSAPAAEKPSVSDILKISMMEAEIDPGAEPMVVDSSSDCGPLTKAPPASSLISSSKQTLAHGAFSRVKSKELDIIQVIPQYSIMPDSSQSNVVVEPSGFLEISDYTSQRLDEEAAMEQEVDSSNDEGAAASPTADQSQ